MQRLCLVWSAAGEYGEPELRVLVNDADLQDVVRPVELPHAEDEGSPNIAGAYAGLPSWALRGKLRQHFLGGPESHMFCGPRDKTVLLGCECGEPGCWPLMAQVEVGPSEVTWTDFEQPHRRGRWRYDGLGPFTFDRKQYEDELAHAERSTPPSD